ncbi:hypothetical protein EDC01DRAFT_756590 [Geopyxis carbonaria]|nr:hypothetical protein EDC01DRAFT_756590 [Geopyxis carbonaria]
MPSSTTTYKPYRAPTPSPSRRYSNHAMFTGSTSGSHSHAGSSQRRPHSPPNTSSTASSGGAGVYIPVDEPHSYDLLAPTASTIQHTPSASIEAQTERLMGRAHLKTILTRPALLAEFADFLMKRDGNGVKLLVYYLDAQKALKALAYANAIAAGLEAVPGMEWSESGVESVIANEVEERAERAFSALEEELAAYVTSVYISIITHNVTARITGTLRPQLRAAVDGLGESFCLTDPSRPDNPIVFQSAEFNRVTQYGTSYAISRNCRFLQGPRTDPRAVSRLGAAIRAGKETSEVFLNYRRDGSAFVNLLMVAPLRDGKGEVRYFVGAQVDVTQLVVDGIGLQSLKDLADAEAREAADAAPEDEDPLRELTQLFNDDEIATASKHGGRLHRGRHASVAPDAIPESERPRVHLTTSPTLPPSFPPANGLLAGVYKHYLLLRPYPSLRILFTSPSLRTPGIHQLPFLSKLGGSPRVRQSLEDALEAGRGVTAKVLWLTDRDGERGRDRWVHCTPLLDADGRVGVWMVVVVDPPGQPQTVQRVEIYRAPRVRSQRRRGVAGLLEESDDCGERDDGDDDCELDFGDRGRNRDRGREGGREGGQFLRAPERLPPTPPSPRSPRSPRSPQSGASLHQLPHSPRTPRSPRSQHSHHSHQSHHAPPSPRSPRSPNPRSPNPRSPHPHPHPDSNSNTHIKPQHPRTPVAPPSPQEFKLQSPVPLRGSSLGHGERSRSAPGRKTRILGGGLWGRGGTGGGEKEERWEKDVRDRGEKGKGERGEKGKGDLGEKGELEAFARGLSMLTSN